MDKVVVDTSIVIDGEITKLIESGKLKDCEIIVPVAVLDELQSQASQSKDYGFVGLEEIKKIRELAEKNNIVLRFEGERPSMEDIKLARHGRIDAIIKDIAKKNDADRKSTRLNSSHRTISYAVFCLKKKNTDTNR